MAAKKWIPLEGLAGGFAAAFALASVADILLSQPIEPEEALLAVSLAALCGGAVGAVLRLFAALAPSLSIGWNGSWLISVSAGVAALWLGAVAAHALAREIGDEVSLGSLVRRAALLSLVGAVLAAAAFRLWSRARVASATRTAAQLWTLALALCVGAASGALALAAGAALIGAGAWLSARAPGHLARGCAATLAAICALGWPRAPVPQAEAATPAAPRSAILIVLDTVRTDELGAYGAPGNPTPTFDSIAKRGVLFEQAIAPSGWTVPVHASLFTGLAPRVHGVGMHSARRLDDSWVTLAEELSARGYETAAFSGNPWLRVGNMFQGFSRHSSTHFRARDQLGFAALMRSSGLGPDLWIDKGGEETLRELASWLAARKAERPFFLFLNLYEAHGDYLPPVRFRRGGAGEWIAGAAAVERLRSEIWHLASRPRPRQESRLLSQLHASCVRFQDEQLGAMLDLIGGRIDLDTVDLFVTSDHGEHFGEGGRWGHVLSLSETLIRVPLAAAGPSVRPRGARDRAQRSLLDINQTLRRIGGLAEAGEGKPLLGPDSKSWDLVVSEFVPDSAAMLDLIRQRREKATRLDWPIRAARDGRWKLVIHGSGRSQLYDVQRDPTQLVDVAAREPERVAELERELRAWLATHPEKLPPDPRATSAPSVDDAERKRLRALGYL